MNHPVRMEGSVAGLLARRALPALMLALLVAPPALPADVSDTDWQVLVGSRLVVRGVGRAPLRATDVLRFVGEPAEAGEPARGSFAFDRLPLEGRWREARGPFFLGRLDRESLAAALEARINALAGTSDAEVVALAGGDLRGAAGREGQRLRMRTRVRALVTIPSLGIERRPVLVSLRVRGRPLDGEPTGP